MKKPQLQEDRLVFVVFFDVSFILILYGFDRYREGERECERECEREWESCLFIVLWIDRYIDR